MTEKTTLADDAGSERTETSVPDRARARELFERLTALPDDDPERQRLRDQLVEL
ncbi:MAG TPA: RNA polymerase sigma factor SigF, partial [Streptosporangiaceae bacterium]|nr:RNA polymerase sigma factor SigF [Streptosporangiaceae bacterium]